MKDEQIIELYFARRESAIEATEKKYGRYCRYISYNILFDELEAEEVANDTYLKLWDTVPPTRPKSLKAYIAVICRNLSLGRYERSRAKKRAGESLCAIEELSFCIPENEDISDRIALRDLLNRFIGGLSERERQIFVRRYFYVSSVSEIAREYHMTENAAAVMLLRTRKKLKKYLEGEGVRL